MGFNPYNVFALLYSALAYCGTSVSPYLGYQIRAYVRLFIPFFLLRTNILSRVINVCGYNFYFKVGYSHPWFFCLRSLIYSQSAMNRLLSIMSRPNTNWYGLDCSVVWYVLPTAKYVAANISDQGSSSSRSLFCKSYLQTRFVMTWWIFSNIEFACGFSVVAHLALILLSVLNRSFWTRDPGIHFPGHT